MKILNVVLGLDCVSGTPVQVKLLGKALSRQGHDVRVATMLVPHPDLELDEFLFGMNLQQEPDDRTSIYTHFLTHVTQVCQEFKPDVIHAHYTHSIAVAPFVRLVLGIPFVVTLHGLETNDGDKTSRRFRVIREGLACADHVTAVSAALLNTELEYFGLPHSDRYSVLPDCYDETVFSAVKREPTERVNIIAVGRLCEDKGHEYLIRACALLVNEGYLVRLQIVGDGQDRVKLSNLIADLNLGGNVELVGYVPHASLAKLLHGADIFAMPSTWEGLGTSLLEALATGLPAIVSDVGGLPEGTGYGDAGIIVKPRDVDQLFSAMRRLIQDRELRMHFGAKAESRAHQYRSAAIAGRLSALYSRVVAAPPVLRES